MNILSFNFYRIGQKPKRLSIFQKIKQLDSIAFLQETHSDISIEKTWKTEWQGKILFSRGTTNSKGVCTLIPPYLDYNIEKQFRDGTGRIIVAKIKIESIIYILCNAYAPTRYYRSDQMEFIKHIQSTLAPYEHENVLLGGDFNL